MDQSKEKSPTSHPIHTRRNFLKAATALTAAATLNPHEVLAEAANTYEQSPEFFTNFIRKTLERDKPVEVALGIFRISPDIKRTDHFPSESAISDSLKEAPFFQPSRILNPELMQEIENPIIISHNNQKYVVWNSSDKKGNKIPQAVAINAGNWGAIAKTEANQLVLFDKEHDIFISTKMLAGGMAETNYNPNKESEFFCKDQTGKPIPVMRSLNELNNKKD